MKWYRFAFGLAAQENVTCPGVIVAPSAGVRRVGATGGPWHTPPTQIALPGQVVGVPHAKQPSLSGSAHVCTCVPLHCVAPVGQLVEQHFPFAQLFGHAVSVGVEPTQAFEEQDADEYVRRVVPPLTHSAGFEVQFPHWSVLPHPVAMDPHCADADEQVAARQNETQLDSVAGVTESSRQRAVRSWPAFELASHAASATACQVAVPELSAVRWIWETIVEPRVTKKATSWS